MTLIEMGVNIDKTRKNQTFMQISVGLPGSLTGGFNDLCYDSSPNFQIHQSQAFPCFWLKAAIGH
jgi:hypothetical protein